MASDRSLLATSEGTTSGAFAPMDWALVLFCSLVWGSSFLFIAEGLEAFPAETVAFLRVGFGLLTLSLFPSARQRIDRQDWGRVALLGLVMLAVPFTLYAIAQQYVESAVAGMINGGFPITAGVVAAVLLRRLPGWPQRIGLLLGFIGIALVSIPNLGEGGSAAWGIVLALLAIWSYGLANSLVVPLQQKYGSVRVLWRALLVAFVLTAPLGLYGLRDAEPTLRSFSALAALGIGGTGLAFMASTKLAGRVGGARGSIYGYFTTPVAIALGVSFRGESVSSIAFVGAGVIILGAWLVSRSDTGAAE
jgi:drug/metabolite transporter (DMT)-like permease